MSKSNNGWIRLHRSIMDYWVWDAERKFDKFHALVDLFLRANHKDAIVPISGKPKQIHRGQLHTSIIKLSEIWHWDPKTVKSFLIDLKNNGTITFFPSNHGVTISIINYDKYQASLDNQLGTPMDTSLENKADNKTGTNNNEIKRNNNKRIEYSPSFDSFWLSYPKKTRKEDAFLAYQSCISNGFSEAKLLEASKNYAKKTMSPGFDKKYIMYASNFLEKGEFEEYFDDKYCPPKKKKIDFNNFNQRNYDFSDLEKDLDNQ